MTPSKTKLRDTFEIVRSVKNNESCRKLLFVTLKIRKHMRVVVITTIIITNISKLVNINFSGFNGYFEARKYLY
jgi:hypothetical protein